MFTNSVALIFAAILILGCGTTAATVPMVNGQQQQQVESSRTANLDEQNTTLTNAVTTPSTRGVSGAANTTTPTTKVYQSTADGFRIGVPEGWVIEDINNTLPLFQNLERQLGFAPLAMICPQEQASRSINGTYVCPEQASPALRIIRFADLQTRPEFANTTAVVQENNNNRTITISDFLAFVIQFLEKNIGFKNIQIQRADDLTVNVTDPQTNQTVATAPGKYVLFTYNVTDPSSGRDIKSLGFPAAVLSNDTNTGYLLVPRLTPASVMGNLSHEEMGRQIGHMVYSFELLMTPSPLSPAASTTTGAVPLPQSIIYHTFTTNNNTIAVAAAKR